jgi:hypothetical protein
MRCGMDEMNATNMLDGFVERFDGVLRHIGK